MTNKDGLYKENARIKKKKEVLKEIGYQESIISKILKRITNNHSLPLLQQKKTKKQNASHRYQKGRDQNEYKFIILVRY